MALVNEPLPNRDRAARFTPELASALRGQAARRQALEGTPFRLPSLPPGAPPEVAEALKRAFDGTNNWATEQLRPRIAQDSVDLSSPTLGSALGYGYGAAFANGYGFLGYAYLAELMQVAEYRLLNEVLAEEMVRKGFTLKAVGTDEDKTDKIKTLTDRLKDLKVLELLGQYALDDFQFGISHLYLDFGDRDPAERTKPVGDGWDAASREKVNRKHPLKRLKRVEPIWCYPLGYNTTDPLDESWYRPETWVTLTMPAHRSRLLTGIMRPVPDLLKPAYLFGGISLTQMAKPYIDNWLRTRQSVANIVWRYTVNVLSTQLNTLIMDPSGAGLLNRVATMNTVMNNNGTLVLDKESEAFANVSAPIAGLHELQAQSQEHQAAVGRIPFVKLFGITPSGLNATSDGEIRVFYDTVHGMQEKGLSDVLHRVLGFAMLSEYGEVDPAIRAEWNPLFELNETEKAELQSKNAATHAIYLQEQVVSADEVRRAVAADPNSPYAGLDLDKTPAPLDANAGYEDEGGEFDPNAPDPNEEDPGRYPENPDLGRQVSQVEREARAAA